MEIFKPGTKVFVGDSIEGVVLAATIRAHGVACYEVAWWSGNTRCSAWVEPHEVRPFDEAQRPARVGFMTPEELFDAVR